MRSGRRLNLLRRRLQRLRRNRPDQELNLYEVLSWTLERNNHAIEIADAKAAIVSVFAAGFVGLIAAPVSDALRIVVCGIAEDPSAPRIAGAAAFSAVSAVFVIGQYVTIREVFRAITPILIAGRPPGYTFFGDVAGLDRAQWQSLVLQLRSDEIIRDLSQQVYATSRIATMKYRRVQRSIRATFYWFPAGVILYLASLQIV